MLPDFQTTELNDGLTAIKHTERSPWRVYDADDVLFELPGAFPEGALEDAARLYYLGVKRGEVRGEAATQRRVRQALGIAP